MSNLTSGDDDYRNNVGIVIINTERKILAGEAFYYPGEWLMPQGGIAIGETPEEALERELLEETGLTLSDVSIVREYDEWICYLFPKPQIKDGRMYVGQRQKWFLLLYNGPLPDANSLLEKEFSSFSWVSSRWLLDRTLVFNVPVYKQVFRNFLFKPDLLRR